jgi:hypothetical protein
LAARKKLAAAKKPPRKPSVKPRQSKKVRNGKLLTKKEIRIEAKEAFLDDTHSVMVYEKVMQRATQEMQPANSDAALMLAIGWPCLV